MTTFEELLAEEIELQRLAMAAHIRACDESIITSTIAYRELEELKAKLAQIPVRRRALFRAIECGAPSRPIEPGPYGPKAA